MGAMASVIGPISSSLIFSACSPLTSRRLSNSRNSPNPRNTSVYCHCARITLKSPFLDRNSARRYLLSIFMKKRYSVGPPASPPRFSTRMAEKASILRLFQSSFSTGITLGKRIPADWTACLADLSSAVSLDRREPPPPLPSCLWMIFKFASLMKGSSNTSSVMDSLAYRVSPTSTELGNVRLRCAYPSWRFKMYVTSLGLTSSPFNFRVSSCSPG